MATASGELYVCPSIKKIPHIQRHVITEKIVNICAMVGECSGDDVFVCKMANFTTEML